MGTIGIVRHAQAASKGERYWERQVRHFSRSVAKRAHIARGNPAVVAGEHPLFALTRTSPVAAFFTAGEATAHAARHMLADPELARLLLSLTGILTRSPLKCARCDLGSGCAHSSALRTAWQPSRARCT